LQENGLSELERGNPPATRYHVLLWVILALALIGSFVFALWKSPSLATELTNPDTKLYHRLALSILHQFSFEGVTVAAPGYPAFLALVYAVSGESLRFVYFIQSLLFAVTILYVYKLGYFLTRNVRICLITACLCMVWPFFTFAASALLTEILSMALIAVGLYYLTACVERPTCSLCVTVGVLLAVNALVKSVALAFIPVAALIIVLRGTDRMRRLGKASIVFVVAILVIAPWTVRNYFVLGGVVPVATNSGSVFWLGNAPDYQHIRWTGNNIPSDLKERVQGKSRIEKDRIFFRVTASYVRENPLRAMRIFAQKFSNLWLGGLGADPHILYTNHVRFWRGITIPWFSLESCVIVILAVIGWFCLPPLTRVQARPMQWLIIVWTASYVLMYAETRYVLPVFSYSFLLAAVAVSSVSFARPAKKRISVSGPRGAVAMNMADKMRSVSTILLGCHRSMGLSPTAWMQFFYFNLLRKNTQIKGRRSRMLIPAKYCRIEVDGSARIELGGTLTLGFKQFRKSTVETRFFARKNSTVVVDGSFNFCSGADIRVLENAVLTLGGGYCNDGVQIVCAKSVSIGKGCAIARDVIIRDWDAHRLLNTGHETAKAVCIGEHVWVGIRAMILKGVTVGDGAVVAAGSVVTKDVPSKCLVAGVPAKVIREDIEWEC